VKNYFAYALSRSQDDPLDFLDKDLQPLPETGRWMWCTAPFLHAAGREIYQTQDGRWISCSPKDAKALGVQGTAIDVFRFEPIRIQYRMNEVDEKSPHYGLSQSDFESQGRRIAEFYDVTDTEPGASVRVFRYTHRDYNEIMASALAALIETL